MFVGIGDGGWGVNGKENVKAVEWEGEEMVGWEETMGEMGGVVCSGA